MSFKAMQSSADLRMFRVRIVMPDGSWRHLIDHFINGFEAIERTQSHFPDAKRVSALFLGGAST